ncbi:hypothetical protein [Mycobacterium sp. SMC-17]|uniref:hypothetical protein n=1 Tax=Mycobacterium sp. SMC-17 TaxID=3381628 RepID=UPI00387777D5
MTDTDTKGTRKQAITPHVDRAAAHQRWAATTGTVTVERRYPHGHQAVCTCRQLSSRRRLLHGFAVADAHEHAARTGCAPAVPLSSPRIAVA